MQQQPTGVLYFSIAQLPFANIFITIYKNNNIVVTKGHKPFLTISLLFLFVAEHFIKKKFVFSVQGTARKINQVLSPSKIPLLSSWDMTLVTLAPLVLCMCTCGCISIQFYEWALSLSKFKLNRRSVDCVSMGFRQ